LDQKLTATEISWPRASTRVGRRAVLSLIWVEKRHEIARPYSRAARASDRRAGQCGGQTRHVQDLMQMCRGDNTIAEATDKAICLGWIGGATDVMFALGHEPPGTPWAACASGKFVSFAAMRQAFLNWADQHPKLWPPRRWRALLRQLDRRGLARHGKPRSISRSSGSQSRAQRPSRTARSGSCSYAGPRVGWPDHRRAIASTS
jgi:hypothetical protein